MQNQTVKITADVQENVLISSNIDQEIPRKNLKNFPSPVQGSILRSVGNYYFEAFDDYSFHAGIDYAEPEGTVIRATHGGKVIFAGADPILGQKVILDCGEGWLVTYGGLDNLRVQVGKTVENQEALGQVGLFTAAESESNQPQLHYEVWHGDEVQKPL
jgi:murein DD-endopeptidase MepM/ murein hydrolase activator NlpD